MPTSIALHNGKQFCSFFSLSSSRIVTWGVIRGFVDSTDNFTDEAITASKHTNGQMIEKSLKVFILSPYLLCVPFYDDYLGNKSYAP